MAGIDLNTDYSELFLQHTRYKDNYSLFGKAYGKATWNDYSTASDNEYIGGVSLGIKW